SRSCNQRVKRRTQTNRIDRARAIAISHRCGEKRGLFMRILQTLLISGTVSLLSTLSAETTKPYLTPFIMDISPANCSAATSHIVGSGTGINVFRTTVSADGRFHIG